MKLFTAPMWGETLLVPNGVERIGARAFAGTGLQLVSLPETIREIGPDAFDKDTGFEVLPGSYAANWARDNGYGYIEIKIRLNKETLDVYPGGVGTLEAVNSYADDLIYQWEELTDADSWNVIAGQNGKTLRLPYRPNEASTIVRCRAYLNSVQLDYSKTILGVFHPEKIDFVDEDCEVLSGDIVRLAWKSMGAGAAYTLHVWAEDSSGNGHWEPLAQTDSTPTRCTDSITIHSISSRLRPRYTKKGSRPSLSTEMKLFLRPKERPLRSFRNAT